MFGWLKRSKPEAQAAHKRHKFGRSLMQAAGLGRLEKSWTSTPTTIDAQIYQNLSILVARSREQADNNDHAAKFLQLVTSNVVGPNGFTCKSQVKDPSGKADLAAQKAIENAWLEFSKMDNFTVTGTLSRVDVEELLLRQLPVDGEAFLIVHVNREFAHGIAIELVDSCMIDPQDFRKLSNGNHVRHGIEYSERGKPVAYWFADYDEQQLGYITGAKPKKRILAENVIHIFLPERIGQKRGLPWMRTALWRMKMLQGYEDAIMAKKRMEAAMPLVFSDPDADNEDDLPLELGDPGQILDIGNRRLEPNPITSNNSDYEMFVRGTLRSLAAGLKVPYNDLANDLSDVSYSSARHGAIEAREMWKAIQEWFIRQFEERLFQRWLEAALLRGVIKLESGKALPATKHDKYKPVLFRGRRWAWVDPTAESKAHELALSLNLKSRSEIIEDMGRNPEDVFDEIGRENEMMKDAGLDPRLPDVKELESKPTQQDGGGATA